MMSKFSKWVEREPGRQAAITKHFGVSRGFTSNVKLGRKRIPVAWIKDLIRMSKGELKYEDLLPK